VNISKINTFLRLLVVGLLLYPLPIAVADHVPTQAPYDISIACDADGDTTKGDITVTWQESDGFEDSPPERYAIAFSNDNFVESNYAVANSTGWEEALSYKSYVFTASYRETIFGTTADTFYAKVRADNDTDASYSEWTGIVSIDCDYGSTPTTTTTVPPAVPDDATNVSVNYQGKDVYFAWEYTDGNTLVNEFHINYSYDNSIWDRVIITDTTARTYTLDYTNIQTGTFYWTFSVCGDIENGESCTDSDSNNFETTQYVAPTTTVYVAPPPPPPPPPPPEPEKVEVLMEDGSTAEYETYEVEDGTVDRDNERKANEEKWGCYVTNIALERGDCEPYNVALYNSTTTTTTTIPVLKEEDVIVEEEVKVEEKVEVKSEDTVDTKPIVEDTKTEEIVEEPIKEEIVDEEIVEEEPIDDKPVEIIEEDKPIKEDFPDEEVGLEPIETDPLPSEEGEPEVLLTDEEIEELVTETEEAVKEIVVVEVVEEVLEEDATKEEIETAQEEFEAAVEEIVKELPKEKKVEVVKEVAKVKVQNLATADNTTKAVVKAVVKEVTKVETVAELSEEEKVEVGKVLGFENEETAAKDVEIIAEQATKEKNIATAVDEYVDRAIENKDVENYTLADTITEVQVEAFLENPVGSLLDVKIDELDISSIGQDMTSDQREKAQEVVVPVIIASQIIAQAGALIRRF
jgi:hypothetical protein